MEQLKQHIMLSISYLTKKNELVGSVRRVGHVILADFVKESKSARKVSFSFIDFLFE